MRKLCLSRELLRAVGQPVAAVDGAPNTGQRSVFRIRSGVEVPSIVDGPQFVGRDELLQAGERRDLFVVTLFGGRSAGGGVIPGEPVARWTPAVRTRHLNAVPVALPRLIGWPRGDSVDGRGLPVQRRHDA